jgi:hypothetical protein
MELNVELFAQFRDPDHQRLSVILSEDQILLAPEGQARFPLCRASFDHIADLIRRHDAAIAAANALESD